MPVATVVESLDLQHCIGSKVRFFHYKKSELSLNVIEVLFLLGEVTKNNYTIYNDV